MYQKSEEESKKKMESLRADNTKLRNENFNLKGEVNQLKGKLEEAKEKKETVSRTGALIGRTSDRHGTQHEAELEDIRQLQLALQFEEQERRQSKTVPFFIKLSVGDRDMLMQLMLHNPMGFMMRNEEDIQLQRAIEESKKDNPENMTYEQLLELEERLGKVSKGLTKMQIAKIPSKLWRSGVTKQNKCSICFDEFKSMQRVKLLQECGHEYHDECINKWLENEKRCPICNKELMIPNE